MKLFVLPKTHLSSEVTALLEKHFKLIPAASAADIALDADLILTGPLDSETMDRLGDDLHKTVVLIPDLDDKSYPEQFSRGCADVIFLPAPSPYLLLKLLAIAERIRRSSTQKLRDAICSRTRSPLTHKEERLLVCLLNAGTAGANRDELNKACWQHATQQSKTLDTHLFNLRRKLEHIDCVIVHRRGIWVLSLPPGLRQA